MDRRYSALATLAFLVLVWNPALTFAQTELPFNDVAPDHPAFDAITALKEGGILQGYGDGTFRPEKIVSRAEAVKMIVSLVVKEQDLAKLKTSPFSDIPSGAWYLPFVEAARMHLEIIDGPPKTPFFYPDRPVNLAEFLKVTELAYGIDPQSAFSDLRIPLAIDLQDPSLWHYPYLRYALASSMMSANDKGLLAADSQLSRGRVALLLYRLSMFREGRRTQALTAIVEQEIDAIEALLAADKTSDALFASARAVLASRGALSVALNDANIKSIVKITEGFRTAVQAEAALEKGEFDEAIRLAGDAWHLSGKALEFDSSKSPTSERLQALSTFIADAARAKKRKR